MIAAVDDPRNKENNKQEPITATALTPAQHKKNVVTATPLQRADMTTPLTMTKAAWSNASSDYSTILTNSSRSTLSDWNVSECSDAPPPLYTTAVAIDSPPDYMTSELTRDAVDLKFRTLSDYHKGDPVTTTNDKAVKHASSEQRVHVYDPNTTMVVGKQLPMAQLSCADEKRERRTSKGTYDIEISMGILLVMFLATIVIVAAFTSFLIFVSLNLQKVDISATFVTSSSDSSSLPIPVKESSYLVHEASTRYSAASSAIHAPHAAEGSRLQLKALLRVDIKAILRRVSQALARRMDRFIMRVADIAKMAAQIV